MHAQQACASAPGQCLRRRPQPSLVETLGFCLFCPETGSHCVDLPLPPQCWGQRLCRHARLTVTFVYFWLRLYQVTQADR